VPSLRTTVTELATGLGMTGHASLDEALDARPESMVSLAPEHWSLLERANRGGAHRLDFFTAFSNGQAFLRADNGLRNRLPISIEWKGSQRAPGDEVAPIDLRVDHVYLVSCKYLSTILVNASPRHLFDDLLRGPHGRRSGDWYADVAPAEYASLYDAVRRGVADVDLPVRLDRLESAERALLAERLKPGWPPEAAGAVAAFSSAVATATAERWHGALERAGDKEAMLWRLLRMGSAPYFVLGTSPRRSLRLRIATPWDWRQSYRLLNFEVTAKPGGQPLVAWRAEVRHVHDASVATIEGHIEVRWSHGRFGGPPEAKAYLDTPHELVPGYFALT